MKVKDSVNKFLSGLPGKRVDIFSHSYKQDKEELKKIAKYYITLDEDRIVDKLLIIKGEDEQLFNDLIILMGRENTGKMEKVKESLLTPKFKKNPFKRILAEIDRENKEKIDNIQKYYMSLNLAEAIREIERTHAINEITVDELAKLFEKLKPEQTAKYLFYLDEELQGQIKHRLPGRALRNIEKKLEKLKNNQARLLELASIYENKATEEAVSELGNFDRYNAEQLAFIFKNLTLNKSSKILSNVEDNDFISILLNEIKYLEELQKDKKNISSIIMRGITIYKNYAEKVNELTAIYQKTDVKELTEMFRIMLGRNKVYKKYTLDDSEEIIFTEEQLAIDILNKLKTDTVAEILENLKENDRILLSKKLLN